MILRRSKNLLSFSSLSQSIPISPSYVLTKSSFSSSTKTPPPSSSSSSTTTTTKITKTNNANYDSLRDETLCQYSGLPALNQYIDDNNNNNNNNELLSIESDDNLQGHWKSLESRVQKRKTRQKGLGGPEGRNNVRVTGWDAENV